MLVYYVDPMSYSNLALYDRNLLRNLDSDIKIRYFGNIKYEFGEDQDICKIYDYSDKKGIVAKTLSYLKTQSILLRKINEEKPDIVHLQWAKIPELDYLLMKRIKKSSPNTRIVFTAHDLFGHDEEERQKSILLKILTEVDGIVLHTDTAKRELTAVLPETEAKTAVIPHGVLDLGEFGSCASTSNGDAKLSTDLDLNHKFVVGAIGTMDYYKGSDLIYDAWIESEKLSEAKEMVLLFAGRTGDLKKPLQEAKNIKVIEGFITNSDFDYLLSKCDVIALPYRKISQSGLLLSAIKKQKLMLVTDVGELAKPFEFGNVGWIAEEPSKEAVKRRLEEICEAVENKLIPSVPEEVWEKIENYYSWKTAGHLTSQCYKTL